MHVLSYAWMVTLMIQMMTVLVTLKSNDEAQGTPMSPDRLQQ
jgi:hypothetical protein